MNTLEPHKWSTLKVPTVASTWHKGTILRVIGVYLDAEKKSFVINTATKDNKLENMILPKDLHPWAMRTLELIDVGIIPFPCDIEFGKRLDGFVYAEIL
jgi:hypothetical protein